MAKSNFVKYVLSDTEKEYAKAIGIKGKAYVCKDFEKENEMEQLYAGFCFRNEIGTLIIFLK